jgi:hypothetical protein
MRYDGPVKLTAARHKAPPASDALRHAVEAVR